MKKLESGRSMVEMLGVLAIIGVLSVGGIAGYMLSMNRFRANAMLDVANKYAAIVFSSYQSWVANGNAVSDWKAPSLATSKLEGTLQPGTTIAVSKTTNDSEAINGNTVTLSISFPSKDVCETGVGIAGYEILTSGSDTTQGRKCTEGQEDETNNITPASANIDFKQS